MIAKEDNGMEEELVVQEPFLKELGARGLCIRNKQGLNMIFFPGIITFSVIS